MIDTRRIFSTQSDLHTSVGRYHIGMLCSLLKTFDHFSFIRNIFIVSTKFSMFAGSISFDRSLLFTSNPHACVSLATAFERCIASHSFKCITKLANNLWLLHHSLKCNKVWLVIFVILCRATFFFFPPFLYTSFIPHCLALWIIHVW